MDTERSRWVALYVLCTGMLMIVLDISIVNVALPYIQTDLGFSNAGLAWVVNSYLIAFAGLLLLSGRLGDLLGRRNVLMVGLGLFTVASLLCGAAQTEWQLIAARFVQGIGGALASAVILGMIVTLFPEPGEQAKALGVYGFVASSGGAIGGLAGGVLTQLISWHWIFLVNIPIGIVTMWFVLRTVPDDEGLGMEKGTDVPGAVLITASLMLGVYATVASVPWAAVPALLLLAGFVWRQATAKNPLMPLSLFRSRITVGANVVQMLTVAGMFGMFFLVTLYVQKVLGWDALEIGFGFLPVSIVMCVMSLWFSDRLVARFGAQPTLLAGTIVAAVGLGLFVLAPVDGSYWVHVLPGMTLLGLGMGGAFPAMMAVAMSDVAPEDAGIASGLVGTSAEAGAALGLAVLATLAADRTERLLGPGEHSLADTRAALTSGYHLAFAVGTVLLLLAAVICATVLRSVDVHGHEVEQELEPAAA